MSNDILIDDSSAMAGNLVSSVEAIANAVKDSGASFTSAFENLSKDFNSGFSKFIESSKSMNDELIKALESIKINIVNNYKIESEKKERVSKKKEEFGPTRKDFEKNLKDVFGNMKPGMPGFVGPMSPYTEKPTKEVFGPTIKDFEAEQKRIAENAKPGMPGFVGPVSPYTTKLTGFTGPETPYKVNPTGEEFGPTIKDFEANQKKLSEQANILGDGFAELFKVTKQQVAAMSKSGGKTKGKAPDFADVFKPVSEELGYSVYKLKEDSQRIADDFSNVFDPIFNSLRNAESYGIAAEKEPRATESFEPQMSGEYSTYGVRGGEKGVRRRRKITPEMLMELNDTAIPAPETRDIPLSISELKGLYSQKTDHEGRPVTTTKGMMPSLFGQIAGDMQKAGSEFGKILTPIFGNLGGIFGKSIAPFFTNPIAQVGKNLMQSGLQTAAGGAQGFGAFGGAGAVVGGAATAALGVGVVGFGAALTAVTTSVKMAGQAINSMASYVAKFSPATAEQMNLVFNDLQAVIGKALLPVFNAAIPIVRQFADFINFAMNALTPSIGIVTEAFQTIIPPLIELGATLIDAFMPVIRFAVSLLKGLAMVLEPIINGFAVLVDSVSMMFEIFTKGMDITQLMINGFKLIADVTNILVGAFNWVVAAFYAGVGTLMKVLADAIDWVDGPGRGEWSKGIMEMGDEAIAGAKKIQMVSEEQMQAGLDGKKFSYKAGSLKGKEDIKKNSSFGMAVREAQAMSIESLGDTIRKAAITAQAPESQDKQEEYMKTVSENTAYEKQKKAMVDAIKESGLVNDSGTPSWDSPSGNDSYDPEADFMNAMMGNGVM